MCPPALPLPGVYVNADVIQKSFDCTVLDAAITAERIRNRLLEAGADLSFEAVLSTDRNIELIRKAKANGYKVCVVFVVTKNSDINVARVRARVLAGGHDVPEDKIRSRYEKSLRNIAKAINGEVIAKVDSLQEEISDVKRDVSKMQEINDERNAKSARTRILRFGDEILLCGTEYDQFCREHPDFKNHMTERTMKLITKTYDKCLEENSFL